MPQVPDEIAERRERLARIVGALALWGASVLYFVAIRGCGGVAGT